MVQVGESLANSVLSVPWFLKKVDVSLVEMLEYRAVGCLFKL